MAILFQLFETKISTIVQKHGSFQDGSVMAWFDLIISDLFGYARLLPRITFFFNSVLVIDFSIYLTVSLGKSDLALFSTAV